MSYKEAEAEGVWIIAEQEEGKIHTVTYELIQKGKELANKLNTELSTVYLIPNSENKQELIYRGSDKIYLIEDKEFGEPNEQLYKENIVELVKKEKPEIILVGATNFGRSVAPRIASALETGLTADCTGMKIDEEGEFVQIRPAFTGSILAHIKTNRSPKMSTVRYKEFEEAERNPNREGKTIKVEPIKKEEDQEIEILEIIENEEQVELEDAEIVVSIGQGLKDPKDFDLIKELTTELNGTMGVSRPLVDDGWINKEHQVGYSGKRVKPKLYIANGISGASQHLAGMKESETIVAINTDPSAPIFNYADYGIVGDLYEVIPEIIKELKNIRGEK